ncbi:hypothetical protein LJR186_003933 [Microbacterium foliorum]|jgi:hypothetical protein|uniref:hypothetical protein n=1 Tax=Microbacterium profundi TaxID=450380 RepID=UPI001F3229EC|nr:hypothetical protein [Microbacterium profundi]MCE7483546.1 hypothetical protein [Microbacterium profundi]
MVDDELADGAQPHCCGVVMRDRPGVLVCVVCGGEASLPRVAAPPVFVGASLYGG